MMNDDFSQANQDKTIEDDDRTVIFSTNEEDSSSKNINSDDLFILSETEQKNNELEQIRLLFLHDVHEGKPIDARHYWRKASKPNQAECRLILDNAWFRYFCTDVPPKVDMSEFRAKATALGIAPEQTFLDKLDGIVLPIDPVKQLQEAISLWILGGVVTSYQAQKIYTGRESELVMGDYLVLEFLGEGGMGRVLKARHIPSQRIVALKLFDKSKDNSGSGLDRFKREIMLAKRMMHPNIIIAYDSGETEEYDYLAIEYVDGPDLSKMVKWEGPVPVKKAIHYMIQAAEALAYAHRQQVIHRDVKPHNMMVDDNDVLKILDLGLGRLSWMKNEPGEGGLTQTGQFLGTVDFLAPEQAVSARTADERSDIYALGATMFYILTGRVMFKGDSIVSKIFAHQNEERPSLLEFNPEVPQVLDHLYRRMTARDAQNRIQSMEEVSQHLKDIRDGKDIYIGIVPDSDAFSRSATFIKDAAMGAPGSASKTAPNSVSASSDVYTEGISQGSLSGQPQNDSLAAAGKFIGIGAGALALVLLVYLIYSVSQSYVIPTGEVQITGLPDQVRLELLNAHNESAPVTINSANGKQSFKVPYGEYSIRATAPYYKDWVKSFKVDVALVPPIHGTMVYSSSLSFADCMPMDAFCEILSEGKTLIPDFQVSQQTQPLGLPPGDYQLRIHASGWESLQMSKKVEEGKDVSVSYSMQLAQSIKLQIPSDMKPYSDVEVALRPKKSNAAAQGSSFKKILTPDEFAASSWRTIPLLPNVYRLSIVTNGFQPVEEEITLKNFQTVSFDVPLKKTPQADLLEQLLAMGAQFRFKNEKGESSPIYGNLKQWKGEQGQTVDWISLEKTKSINDALGLILASNVTFGQINAQHAQSDAKTAELAARIKTRQPGCEITTNQSSLDWRAASLVLKAGGKVWIRENSPDNSSEEKEIFADSIPNSSFFIVRIDLKGNKIIRKDDLALMSKLLHLNAICLTDVPNLFPVDLIQFTQNPKISLYHKTSIVPNSGDFSAIERVQCAQFPLDRSGSVQPLVVFLPKGKVVLWNLTEFSLLREFENVQMATLSPDGTLLAVATGDGSSVQVYDISKDVNTPAKEIRNFSFSLAKAVISNDNKLMLGSSEQGKYALWDLDTLTVKYTDSINQKITCIAINNQGSRFILAGEKNAMVYQVNNGSLFGALNAEKEKITNAPVFMDLCFTEDDKSIYSNISGQSLNIWGMEGANSCRNLALLESYGSLTVQSLVMNNARNTLWSGGRSAQGYSGLTSYNVAQNNAKKDWNWKGGAIDFLTSSPSGNMIAAVTGSQIRFINQGEEVLTLVLGNEKGLWAMYSPSGLCSGTAVSHLKFISSPNSPAKPIEESKFDLQNPDLYKILLKNW